MQKLLERIATDAGHWTELRFHARRTKRIAVRNGILEESSTTRLTGVGVRVLVDGVLGFAATTDLSEGGIRRAVADARAAAQGSAAMKKVRIPDFGPAEFARGSYALPTDDPLDGHSLEEKLNWVMRADELVRKGAGSIVSSSAQYEEFQDEKIVVTSDGASARLLDSKPEFRVVAVAQANEDQAMGLDSASVTGGWSDLFRDPPDEMAARAVRLAVDQLAAPHPAGGRATVVLDPGLVGVMSHEAIGHTVEADIVLGGAVTARMMGKQVASELITLCDSGRSEHRPHATGTIPFDDEGVMAGRTVIIDRGVLRSYLHNRETAAHFGVEPTGNARAFEYSDDPIIRMRNTYIEPGQTSVEELIAGVETGYYLCGLGFGGQADSNAEFMFGVREARRIENGRIGKLLRSATISGNAFNVLKSVDAVGDDFDWSLGAGRCGKTQLAKVDAGGPHLRCVATIGGRQG